MKTTAHRLAIPALLAATAVGLGYYAAPREILDSEARSTGFLQVDTSRVLSATVEALRDSTELVVWQYKATARVRAERRKLWILTGSQDLVVPAVVGYRLDLSKLTPERVAFDPAARLVTVKLPPLELGDVAFEPERSTTVDGGLLTFSENQTDALRRFNYRSARKALIKQAQGKAMTEAAKSQARKSVEAYFERPLRAAGLPDVRVVATF